MPKPPAWLRAFLARKAREEAAERERARQAIKIPPNEFCGARTRAGGPCRQRAIYSNGRCKWHGGLSTGPKTPEGKARSAANGFKKRDPGGGSRRSLSCIVLSGD